MPSRSPDQLGKLEEGGGSVRARRQALKPGLRNGFDSLAATFASPAANRSTMADFIRSSLSLRQLFSLHSVSPGPTKEILHARLKVCFKTYHHIFVPCNEVGKLSLDSDTSSRQTLTRNINRRMLILLEPTEPSDLHKGVFLHNVPNGVSNKTMCRSMNAF
jgi:hypothetical protein